MILIDWKCLPLIVQPLTIHSIPDNLFKSSIILHHSFKVVLNLFMSALMLVAENSILHIFLLIFFENSAFFTKLSNCFLLWFAIDQKDNNNMWDFWRNTRCVSCLKLRNRSVSKRIIIMERTEWRMETISQTLLSRSPVALHLRARWHVSNIGGFIRSHKFIKIFM